MTIRSLAGGRPSAPSALEVMMLGTAAAAPIAFRNDRLDNFMLRITNLLPSYSLRHQIDFCPTTINLQKYPTILDCVKLARIVPSFTSAGYLKKRAVLLRISKVSEDLPE